MYINQKISIIQSNINYTVMSNISNKATVLTIWNTKKKQVHVPYSTQEKHAQEENNMLTFRIFHSLESHINNFSSVQMKMYIKLRFSHNK